MELVKRTVENSRKSDMQINKGQARYPFTIGKYPESSNIGHSKKNCYNHSLSALDKLIHRTNKGLNTYC